MQISKAKIKFVQSLRYKKYRQKHAAYVVEGIKACKTVIESGLKPMLIVFNRQLPEFFLDNENTYEADEQIMKSVSSFDTAPSLICVFSLMNERENKLNEAKGNVILFLDRIQDPGNLGTIIRTADWFGVQSMILNKGCADVYNAKSIQAAMGCHVNMTFYYAEFEEVRRDLNTFVSVGLDMGGVPLDPMNFEHASVILIVGNEGQGLSEDILKQVNHLAQIPGHPQKIAESLNAGIATAISLDRLLGSR